jgi:membrane protein YdbS with pleckstrin-like domain
MTNLLWFVFIALLFLSVLLFRFEWYVSYFLGIIAMIIVMSCTWNCIVLNCISYTIDIEQIIIKRGVFSRTTNYMEMYRIYDFQKRQNIIEVAFGIMNVMLLSRDMSNSEVIFWGVTNSDDVIPLIRNRVETEKQKKKIVEFNNPYGFG